ncbi:Csu type fimbrial protein [Chimaeribacter arupi]|uniref:Csu type fimbrial protein n=1 Tax=Chimaeribacter arupi TaxID=2060066 RepID=UPI002947B821|nr:spore coat U domain-containing protein [Chimaeribacter arupi]MDV5140035.1 spore coat U domain-containing protein [Chimaeribacter arupi]
MRCRFPAWLPVMALLLASGVGADTGVDDLSKSQAFTLSATLVNGCVLGSGSADVSTFGSLSFGTISSLAVPVDAVTSQGSGSIVLKCTPGAPVTLALGNGNNVTGSIAAGRRMLNTATNETLAYQLYQNAARTTVWGNGSNGGTTLVLSANGAVQEYKIYARVLPAATMPSAGNYSDSVLVTVTY